MVKLLPTKEHMQEEIAFIDKEIQRLEDITKKTYYRLAYFRRVKQKLEGVERANPQKLVQLSLFGT